MDVRVASVGPAKSLAGGRLMPTPLVFRDPSVKQLFGFAAGQVVLNGSTETAGVIKAGARTEEDVFQSVVVKLLEKLDQSTSRL